MRLSLTQMSHGQRMSRRERALKDKCSWRGSKRERRGIKKKLEKGLDNLILEFSTVVVCVFIVR